MIRSLLIATSISLMAAAAIAAIAPGSATLERPRQTYSIMPKNQAFPVLGPIVVVPCSTEDCSEPGS